MTAARVNNEQKNAEALCGADLFDNPLWVHLYGQHPSHAPSDLLMFNIRNRLLCHKCVTIVSGKISGEKQRTKEYL